jgi:hypothetical protein
VVYAATLLLQRNGSNPGPGRTLADVFGALESMDRQTAKPAGVRFQTAKMFFQPS